MAFLSRLNPAGTVQQSKTVSGKVHQLMQLSKYDRAISLLESLLAQNSLSTDESALDYDVMYQYYGVCLVQSGRYAEAVEVLSKGVALEPEGGNRCKETLYELALPAIQKHILECTDIEETDRLIKALQQVSPDSALVALKDFLSVAAEYYRLRDFSRSSAAYECILPLADQLGCLDFEDILRAADSCVKCNQLNKAWKLYKNAEPLADTYSKECRLHKKIADLLVIRNQDWHAIFHFLVALQAVPSDKGARTKLKKTLKRLGIERHINKFLQLNTTHSDHRQLEISLLDLRKKLKAS